jgi:hypothetical protein
MALDHTGATTAYVMLREGHLWNVSEFHRVHISNLVTFIPSTEKVFSFAKVLNIVTCRYSFRSSKYEHIKS